jgi:hypothetical protein
VARTELVLPPADGFGPGGLEGVVEVVQHGVGSTTAVHEAVAAHMWLKPLGLHPEGLAGEMRAEGVGHRACLQMMT